MNTGDLARFAEALPDPALLLRPDGRILAANNASLSVLGRGRADLLGLRLQDLATDVGAAEALLWRFAGAASGNIAAVTLRCGDAGARPFRCSGGTIAGADGRGPALLVLLRERHEASAGFLHLKQEIEELNREIRRRREVEQRLRQAIEERDVLVREVHHRVRNNLQILISLLSFARGFAVDGAAREELGKAQVKVAAMAAVHNLLYRSTDYSRVELTELLRRLAELVQTLYEESRHRIALDIEPIELTLEASIPVALVVNELLTNAFKHAFTPGTAGLVAVGCRAEGEGRYCLTISDNGRGLPAGQAPRQGFGWRLVEGLVRQLDGEMSMTKAGGMRIQILFHDIGLRPESPGG